METESERIERIDTSLSKILIRKGIEVNEKNLDDLYIKTMDNSRRDIPGYEGLYQINSQGLVKSFRKSNRYDDIILKAQQGQRGGKSITLFKNGQKKKFLISDLIFRSL